jgi:hypothetical protein
MIGLHIFALPGVADDDTTFFPKTEFITEDFPMFGSPCTLDACCVFRCTLSVARC